MWHLELEYSHISANIDFPAKSLKPHQPQHRQRCFATFMAGINHIYNTLLYLQQAVARRSCRNVLNYGSVWSSLFLTSFKCKIRLFLPRVAWKVPCTCIVRCVQRLTRVLKLVWIMKIKTAHRWHFIKYDHTILQKRTHGDKRARVPLIKWDAQRRLT